MRGLDLYQPLGGKIGDVAPHAKFIVLVASASELLHVNDPEFPDVSHCFDFRSSQPIVTPTPPEFRARWVRIADFGRVRSDSTSPRLGRIPRTIKALVSQIGRAWGLLPTCI